MPEFFRGPNWQDTVHSVNSHSSCVLPGRKGIHFPGPILEEEETFSGCQAKLFFIILFDAPFCLFVVFLREGHILLLSSTGPQGVAWTTHFKKRGTWNWIISPKDREESCQTSERKQQVVSFCINYISYIYIYTFIVIVLCIKTSKHATNMWSQRWQGTHPFSSFELHFQPQSLDFFVDVPLNRIEKGRHKSAYIPKRKWNHWKTTSYATFTWGKVPASSGQMILLMYHVRNLLAQLAVLFGHSFLWHNCLSSCFELFWNTLCVLFH